MTLEEFLSRRDFALFFGEPLTFPEFGLVVGVIVGKFAWDARWNEVVLIQCGRPAQRFEMPPEGELWALFEKQRKRA